MKQICELHVKFEFDDEDVDSLSDAQWLALNKFRKECMGDESWEDRGIKLIKFEIL
jgi:hypothetical protein